MFNNHEKLSIPIISFGVSKQSDAVYIVLNNEFIYAFFTQLYQYLNYFSLHSLHFLLLY